MIKDQAVILNFPESSGKLSSFVALMWYKINKTLECAVIRFRGGNLTSLDKCFQTESVFN